MRSPEREKLNEPTNVTSSATTILACMKSCSDSGVHRVDGLPENGAAVSTVFSSGIFQALTPFVAHWWKTSSTCVSSMTPATSQRCSFTTSTSVARIGPEVSTGDAILIRLRARPRNFATRWESASPYSGVNQARVSIPSGTVTGRGSTRPVCSTWPRSQSSSRLRVNARASAGAPSTLTITFSWRLHESSVQFVEPDHTSVASRTTNLWCIRSGTPAIARVGTGKDAIAAGSVEGGGGTGIGPGWSTL